MTDPNLLKRITANPEIFGGKPIIRGMRISVELILSLLAQGETVESILSDYLDLEPEDLRACLAYAHAVIAHDSPALLRGSSAGFARATPGGRLRKGGGPASEG